MTGEVLEEGDDVYFVCKTEANPGVEKVEWTHDVSAPYMNNSYPVYVFRMKL